MSREAPAPAQQHSAAISRGGLDDLDEVMRIMTASFPAAFGEGWTRSQCAGILPMAGVALRLARDAEGKAVGFALMRIVADEAELLLVAVDPSVQRAGIGKALLDDFIASAAARSAERLHLEVREDNPATALYRRAGFAPVGRRRAYYRGPGGEVRDALTLARGA